MTDERHRQVRDDSDDLLHALEDLKRMEKAKREADISTPPFHQLAEEVEAQARHVFRVAAEETVDGNRAPTSDVSTNEVRPSDDRSH
jgi:hypothetical protein